MIWDFLKLFSLSVVSIALYFNIIGLIKKVNKGEETLKDTIIGSVLFLYIILFFYIQFQNVFKII